MINDFDKEHSKIFNKTKGDIGETLATMFLKEKGYKIIKNNYKNYIGEIDIIAKKDGVLCFIEVKRRLTLAYGRPIEAVDFRKQQKIKKTAEFYLMTKHQDYADVRFDVVEILDDKCSLIVDAFR